MSNLLKPENCNKRLDTLGRITLPKGLRDRFYLQTGDELALYTMEYENTSYICMTPIGNEDHRAEIAKQILEELEIELPEKLMEMLEDA